MEKSCRIYTCSPYAKVQRPYQTVYKIMDSPGTTTLGPTTFTWEDDPVSGAIRGTFSYPPPLHTPPMWRYVNAPRAKL